MKSGPHRQARTIASAVEAGEPRFVINPDLDLDVHARTFAETGRVRIYRLLSRGAEDLYEYLRDSEDWVHLISTADGVLELRRDAKVDLGPAEWARIEADCHERTRTAFQYRYEGLRVPEPGAGEAHWRTPLDEFADLMQSEPMLALLRKVTGAGAMSFTDGQATAYGHGDFLTGHDDDVKGKNRLAAYVYGLTPGWRIEYGGMLLFHGEQDRTASGLAPRFNTLDLFSVPQQHSVSMVTPAAPHRRFAITGWLRSGARGD